MAIYLKKFENHTQYETYINGSGAILPNVSLCTTEGDVYYKPSTPVPPTPIETRLVAKYDVIDTSSPTALFYSDGGDEKFSEIEIDDVVQPSVVNEYTFSTLGEHTVKYTLTDPTSIGDYVFFERDITSINIPNSVTSIGDSAFASCRSLTSIVIPDSVTSIGYEAFQYCGLTSCTIGSGVTSIGDEAFYGCGLTSIDIPSSVTSIGDYAFYQCGGLTSINIGSGVTSISSYAFQDCRSLTRLNSDVDGVFNIPNGVTSIGFYAFNGCSGLTSIVIPDSVISIDSGAFGCCNDLDAASIAAIEAINPDNAFYCD